jgi:hypothetical protein
MTKRVIAVLLIVMLAGFVVYGFWPDKGMASRDLQCVAIADARAQGICRRLEQELQWTWLGHAIIAPGWRVSFDSVRRTYCGEKIGPRGIAALELLRKSAKDWRAENGADFLLRLIRNKDGTGDEDIASVFNPANPGFILKDGCPP